MHRFIVFILIILTFQLNAQINCDRYIDDYIPTDLNDAISYLNCVWSDTSKVAFKNKPENDAVAELHFGTGLYMRNNWGLWEGKGSLYNSFKSKGIFHPDDMSSIIITSFHRTLNETDIQLLEQIADYQKYWNAVKIENAHQKEIDREEYKNYNVSDSVLMNFTIARKNNYAHLYNLGKEEEIKLEKNCLVEGIIKKKKGYKKGGFVVLIEILNICNYEYDIIYNSKDGHLEVGDLLPYNMSVYNISKK
jgi:hypothetical protein